MVDNTRDMFGYGNSGEEKEFKYLKTFVYNDFEYLAVTNAEDIPVGGFSEDCVLLRYK